MKKLLFLVLFGLLVVLPLSYTLAQAEPPTKCTLKHEIVLGGVTGCSKGAAITLDSDTAVCCVFDAIYTITDLIFVGLIALSALFVFMGAFNIMTAGGEPEKVSTGRNYILYAAVGIFAAFIAKAVPGFVRYIGGFGK